MCLGLSKYGRKGYKLNSTHTPSYVLKLALDIVPLFVISFLTAFLAKEYR